MGYNKGRNIREKIMDLEALKTLKTASQKADAKSHARHGMAEEQFQKAI